MFAEEYGDKRLIFECMQARLKHIKATNALMREVSEATKFQAAVNNIVELDLGLIERKNKRTVPKSYKINSFKAIAWKNPFLDEQMSQIAQQD